jgi:hypothetical protein
MLFERGRKGGALVRRCYPAAMDHRSTIRCPVPDCEWGFKSQDTGAPTHEPAYSAIVQAIAAVVSMENLPSVEVVATDFSSYQIGIS